MGVNTKTISFRTLFLSVLVIIAAEIAGTLLSFPDEATRLLKLGVIRTVEILLLFYIVIRVEGSMTALGISRSKWVVGIQKGLVWSAIFAGMAAAGFIALALLQLDPIALIRAPLPRNDLGIGLFFLVGAIIAPVAEELFFRGILYDFFRRWGVTAALIISTFLFAALHSTGPRLPIIQITGGIVFALAYEREKSLLVPIVIHVLGNASIFTLSLF